MREWVKSNIHKVKIFSSDPDPFVLVPDVHGIDCFAVFHSTALAWKGMTGTAASAGTSLMTTKLTILPPSTATWR